MNKLMPTIYFWIALLLMAGAHFILPAWRYLTGPYRFLGALLLLVGAVLNLWTDYKVVRGPLLVVHW